MLEQNEAVQVELVAKINKLAESEVSSKDNDDISGCKFIVCGKCGKGPKLVSAFARVAEVPLRLQMQNVYALLVKRST